MLPGERHEKGYEEDEGSRGQFDQEQKKSIWRGVKERRLLNYKKFYRTVLPTTQHQDSHLSAWTPASVFCLSVHALRRSKLTGTSWPAWLNRLIRSTDCREGTNSRTFPVVRPLQHSSRTSYWFQRDEMCGTSLTYYWFCFRLELMWYMRFIYLMEKLNEMCYDGIWMDAGSSDQRHD